MVGALRTRIILDWLSVGQGDKRNCTILLALLACKSTPEKKKPVFCLKD